MLTGGREVENVNHSWDVFLGVVEDVGVESHLKGLTAHRSGRGEDYRSCSTPIEQPRTWGLALSDPLGSN